MEVIARLSEIRRAWCENHRACGRRGLRVAGAAKLIFGVSVVAVAVIAGTPYAGACYRWPCFPKHQGQDYNSTSASAASKRNASQPKSTPYAKASRIASELAKKAAKGIDDCAAKLVNKPLVDCVMGHLGELRKGLEKNAATRETMPDTIAAIDRAARDVNGGTVNLQSVSAAIKGQIISIIEKAKLVVENALLSARNGGKKPNTALSDGLAAISDVLGKAIAAIQLKGDAEATGVASTQP